MTRDSLSNGANRLKVKGMRRFWMTALFFSIFTNLLMLTGPLFMLQVYDRVLSSQSEATLVALFSLVVALYFFFWLIEYSRGRVMARAAGRFQVALSSEVFDAMLIHAAHGSRVVRNSALRQLESIRKFLASSMLLAIFDMPWTPVFLGAIFIFHPMLGWLALAGSGVLIAVTVTNQFVTRRKTGTAEELSFEAEQIAKNTEFGAEYVWAQGMSGSMRKRWLDQQFKAIEVSISAQDWTGAFTSFTKSFRLLLQSAILALGAYLVLQNQLTPGAMIAASILMGRALAPVEQSLSQWPMAQHALTARRQLKEGLAYTPKIPDPMKLPTPNAELEVISLSIAAEEGRPPLLNNVSFKVSPGEVVGFIGRSGTGKSTLARAITGLVKPSAGEVRLGGATLEQLGPETTGKYIGYVPQEPLLYDGTIAENIAQMETEPDADKVVLAAEKARVHDVVLSLPRGYDTQISQSQSVLSGGQKQRLALARAMYRDPLLLVLDEPSSALDSEGSDALNRAINDMKSAGKAVVVMTHSPIAMFNCDRLIVIERGMLVKQGTREEIISSMMANAEKIKRLASGGSSDT